MFIDKYGMILNRTYEEMLTHLCWIKMYVFACVFNTSENDNNQKFTFTFLKVFVIYNQKMTTTVHLFIIFTFTFTETDNCFGTERGS